MTVILVASVHHTGTKLVHDDILGHLTTVNPETFDFTNPGELPELGKIRFHLESQFLEQLIWWRYRSPIIVPLLHPRTVAIGWAARQKRREELGEQWKILKGEIDPFHPHYLPIDQSDRDERLRKIEKELGLKLKTDWPTIGHCDVPRSELSMKDEHLLKGWMNDGFFEQFGYYY